MVFSTACRISRKSIFPKSKICRGIMELSQIKIKKQFGFDVASLVAGTHDDYIKARRFLLTASELIFQGLTELLDFGNSQPETEI